MALGHFPVPEYMLLVLLLLCPLWLLRLLLLMLLLWLVLAVVFVVVACSSTLRHGVLDGTLFVYLGVAVACAGEHRKQQEWRGNVSFCQVRSDPA